jgi:hypothetical protein
MYRYSGKSCPVAAYDTFHRHTFSSRSTRRQMSMDNISTPSRARVRYASIQRSKSHQPQVLPHSVCLLGPQSFLPSSQTTGPSPSQQVLPLRPPTIPAAFTLTLRNRQGHRGIFPLPRFSPITSFGRWDTMMLRKCER